MSAYWAIFSARFRMLLQYRAAAAAGFGTQVFWGLIRVMIFGAFYAMNDARQPMTEQETITYIWLGQATLGLLLFAWDGEVRQMIMQGTVAYELVRPLDLYSLWYCRSVANRCAPTLLRCVPMLIVAHLFFGLQLPASWGAAAAWLAATLSAVLLSAAFATLVTITALFTVSARGVVDVMVPCIWFCSGMVVPLPLFPDWAQSVLNFLPFRGIMDTPFRVYLGHIPLSDVVPALAHQLGWTLFVILLGRGLLALGKRRLVVQGG